MKPVIRTMIIGVRRSALAICLMLVTAAVALCTYTVIHNQHIRAQAILYNCRDQNMRHRGTVAELYVLTAELARHATPAKRAQLNASRRFTILLIDQLAPLQDCSRVLAKSTSTR